MAAAHHASDLMKFYPIGSTHPKARAYHAQRAKEAREEIAIRRQERRSGQASVIRPVLKLGMVAAVGGVLYTMFTHK